MRTGYKTEVQRKIISLILSLIFNKTFWRSMDWKRDIIVYELHCSSLLVCLLYIYQSLNKLKKQFLGIEAPQNFN